MHKQNLGKAPDIVPPRGGGMKDRGVELVQVGDREQRQQRVGVGAFALEQFPRRLSRPGALLRRARLKKG
jgi:hypothetical protein